MEDLEALGPSEAENILWGDLDPNLPAEVRASMLDLVLAFANLDGSVAFLASMIAGLNPREGADKLGRKTIGDKLKIAIKILKDQGREDDAAVLQTVKDQYPGRSALRNRIAHSRCAGVRRSDPTRVIFLPYEGEGPDDSLALEIYGPPAFEMDRKWAEEMHISFMQVVDRHDFFQFRSS